jgi:hypothetical protein
MAITADYVRQVFKGWRMEMERSSLSMFQTMSTGLWREPTR